MMYTDKTLNPINDKNTNMMSPWWVGGNQWQGQWQGHKYNVPKVLEDKGRMGKGFSNQREKNYQIRKKKTSRSEKSILLELWTDL